MNDTVELKKEHEDEFDAFTDGATVHRKYRLRTPKPKKIIKEDPIEKKSHKKPIKINYDRTYNCPKCTKSFDSKTGLLNHLRMHNVVRKLMCALCQKEFDTNEELIEHKIIHKDEDRVFMCKMCRVAFTNHCDFLIHDLSHTKRKMYKCVECAMYFTPSYIKRHIETHFDKSVNCSICGKTYRGELILKCHMKTHDSANSRECGECGRVFKDKKMFDYHMLTHTGIKPFQCLYCGVGFINNSQRKIHTQRLHIADRPYACKLCDKKFKVEMDLKSHMNTHDRKKEFECDVCGKQFLHRMSLQFHRKVHTNENMFECPECDRKCATRQALRTHMVYIHTDSKDFKCEVCNLSYKTISAIRKHNNSKMHKRAEYGFKMNKKK